ncbi:MAG: hypothetical protein HLX51_11770 [Micrococcaceae bacterium]|nr:hypothetical protein [Micrococcaceae bacterium]
MRTVVLLCGPPGAGKSTVARKSGLTVFDRDDEHWLSERHFTDALKRLREDPAARAVVIRSGATSSARHRAAAMVGATDTYMLTAPRDELLQRVRDRGRNAMREQAGVKQWLDSFDGHDGVRRFPGWPAVFGEGIGTTSRKW